MVSLLMILIYCLVFLLSNHRAKGKSRHVNVKNIHIIWLKVFLWQYIPFSLLYDEV